MFLYNRGISKKINSSVLSATAADSLSDCIATFAVLISTVVGAKTGLLIDGYCGLLVTCFIFKAGFETAKDTLGQLLGMPPEQEFVDEIEKTVMAHKLVCGIHDLVVHDYGPGRIIISLHAEVDKNSNILEIQTSRRNR